jgi:hypothetical protein
MTEKRTGNFTRQQYLHYIDGVEARNNDLPVSANPLFEVDEYFCFWNCGWHQADMDKGVRVYQGPITNIKRMMIPSSTPFANTSTRFQSIAKQEAA